MNKLSWIFPLTIVCAAIVDVFLVYIYMRFLHPWKDILFYKDKKSKTEKTEIANQNRVTEETEEEVASEIIPNSIDLEDDLRESTDL